jgi:hypothetical protein
VTFSANSDAGATVNASASLFLLVNLGLNALNGTANANVSLDLDASLGLQGSANPQLCLTGNADINVGTSAQGSFFGLFESSTGGSLFDQNFPLFQVRAHNLLYTFFFRILIIPSTHDSNASSGPRIRRLRLARLTPLRRPIQGVTTTLPEHYDTAHDLDDHIMLFRREPALISIPSFEIIKSDIIYVINVVDRWTHASRVARSSKYYCGSCQEHNWLKRVARGHMLA